MKDRVNVCGKIGLIDKDLILKTLSRNVRVGLKVASYWKTF